MFLSALSPQPRHPAPTPPRSHSPKPTPGTSRQAPAANPGKGPPLSSSPPHPNSPHPPLPPPVQLLRGVRGRSPHERRPRARRFLQARPFQGPAVPGPCAPYRTTAPGSHPRPRRPLEPPLSPAVRSLPRPCGLPRRAPSCAPPPPASSLPPVPRFPAEQSARSP